MNRCGKCGSEFKPMFVTDIYCQFCTPKFGENIEGPAFGHEIRGEPLIPRGEFRHVDVDMVNHPPHYTQHPSGIECIQITEHMGFNIGNAVKYAWRADLKGNAIEDIKKAIWYLERELQRRGAK